MALLYYTKKTYNIEFVAEYNVSEISISELKNIINPKKDDENVFLIYTLDIPQDRKSVV